MTSNLAKLYLPGYALCIRCAAVYCVVVYTAILYCAVEYILLFYHVVFKNVLLTMKLWWLHNSRIINHSNSFLIVFSFREIFRSYIQHFYCIVVCTSGIPGAALVDVLMASKWTEKNEDLFIDTRVEAIEFCTGLPSNEFFIALKLKSKKKLAVTDGGMYKL